MVGPSQRSDTSPVPLREILTDAIRYWEPRRLPYNAILIVVVLGRLAFTWPYFRGVLTAESLLGLFILSVLANVCYCAAYLPDIAMQYSAFRGIWRVRRWGLWLTGVLMAAALAYFGIANEIHPSAH